MEQIVGHKLNLDNSNWGSGVPILRSREPVSGYFAWGYLQAGNGCESLKPEVNTSYDTDRNLTWSVSNANTVYVRELCGNTTCIRINDFPVRYQPASFGWGNSTIKNYPVINNAASGYEEPTYDNCTHYVFASNKCCADEEKCLPPACCLYEEAFRYSDDGCLLSSTLFWSAYGSNSGYYINGMPVSSAGSMELPFGSDRAERYEFLVESDCGFVALCSFDTHCCSTKDNFIISVSGFEDYSFTFEDINYDYECETTFPNGVFADAKGSITIQFNSNLSILNGTHIIPVCWGGLYSVAENYPCLSRSIDTGLKVVFSYAINSNSVSNDYSYGGHARITIDSTQNVEITFDVFISSTGFNLRNAIIHTVWNYDYSVVYPRDPSNPGFSYNLGGDTTNNYKDSCPYNSPGIANCTRGFSFPQRSCPEPAEHTSSYDLRNLICLGCSFVDYALPLCYKGFGIYGSSSPVFRTDPFSLFLDQNRQFQVEVILE